MDVTFNFDPNCQWTWLTSRWLLRAADAEGFAVRYAPLSLTHLDRDNDDLPPQDRAMHAHSRPLLRVIANLESAGDHEAIRRLYDAYGDAVHRHGQEKGDAAALVALDAAGIGRDAAAAFGDDSYDEAIGTRTDAVVAAAGGGVGSPVLTWAGRDGGVAAFGPLVCVVPDVADSVALWRAARTLAELRGFAELRLARGEPQLATS